MADVLVERLCNIYAPTNEGLKFIQYITRGCVHFFLVLINFDTFWSNTSSCQNCNDGEKPIAFCQHCKAFLDKRCVEFHKKIKSLLGHSILFRNDDDRKLECENCVDGGKAIAYCRDCGFFLDVDCIEYHRKIKKLTNHSIIHLLQNNIKPSMLSPKRYCPVSNHDNDLSFFCLNKRELVCIQCHGIKNFDNVIDVKSIYKLIDLIYEIQHTFHKMQMVIPEGETTIKAFVADLQLLTYLGPFQTIDFSLLSSAHLLSYHSETYRNNHELPFTKDSLCRLKRAMHICLQDLRNMYEEYHRSQQSVGEVPVQEVVENHVNFSLCDDSIEEPEETDDRTMGAIGATSDSLNSMELFGEGIQESTNKSANQCYQEPVDSDIRAFRKEIDFAENSYNHDSFANVH